MKIRESKPRRSIEFDRIRDGTVFTMDGRAYIKGDGKYAVDLDTGHVLEPDKIGEWTECYMYLGASLSLT